MARRTLNRERITDTALDLLDEHGIDGLSTRRLADTLEIKSASLYHHFSNKDELLDEMCSAMFAACLPPALPETSTDSWREWLADGARGIRRAALSRRDGASIMARSRVHTEDGAKRFAANVQSLRRVGLSKFQAVAALQSLRCFAVGFAVQEQSPANRNLLTEAQQDQMFENGLNWFLDGLSRHVDGI